MQNFFPRDPLELKRIGIIHLTKSQIVLKAELVSAKGPNNTTQLSDDFSHMQLHLAQGDASTIIPYREDQNAKRRECNLEQI